jgi:hypothetical protein
VFRITTHEKQRQDSSPADSRLRYYLHDGSAAFRFKLSGALAGADVAELEQCWRTAASTFTNKAFVVDLSEVTTVDQAGRELLHLWSRHRAQFLVTSAQGRLLVESVTGNPAQPLSSEPNAEGRGSIRPRVALMAASVLLALTLPMKVWAVDLVTTPVPPAESALARYNAGVERNAQRMEYRSATIDIEASLPKLAKKGRLHAIRYMVPFAKPEYRNLEMAGDSTVTRQVIARYLSAEAQALTLPASEVAVSAANYKIRYVGSIGGATTLAYVFRITPRKKRAGLIRGELWIDAASGIAVHEAGVLVKQPSVFVRRVEMIKDTDLREGQPSLRITHLAIDTRLIGRAELTITERPELAASVPSLRGAQTDFSDGQ